MTETLLSRLADALRECSDDLEAEVAARHGGTQSPGYPSERRRYARDMQPVVRARALLAEWEEKKMIWCSCMEKDKAA